MIDTIRQKIQEVFNGYERHVPADVIKRLFVSVPSSDETVLTQEIMGYLLEHNYEALKTPQGQSLRERLISTDWQQKEEKKWQSEPMVMPMTTDVSAHPIPIPFSQSNKVLIALVILFVSILLWLWKGKLSAIDTGGNRDEAADAEQVSKVAPILEKEVSPLSGFEKPGRQTAAKSLGINEATKDKANLPTPSAEVTQSLTTEKPETVEAVKPYDHADTHVGDFGLRVARRGSKWGYVDTKDQWHIDPVYDDVMPFQNGKASVILDGQQIVIDGNGVRIREEN